MVQVVYAAIVMAVVVVILMVLYKRRKGEREDLITFRQNSLEKLIAVVNTEITEAIRDDDFRLVGDADYEAILRSKRKTAQASRECSFGVPWAVSVMKAAYRDIVERELPTQEDVNAIYDFSTVSMLDPYVKWELLVVVMKKKYNSDRVIQKIQELYDISRLREVNAAGQEEMRRCFDEDLLDQIANSEVGLEDVTYATCIDVIVNIIFNKTKFLGCVGTLRLLPIDGFHFGTSGSTRYEIEGKWDVPYRKTNSVWVQIDAKWVHFSFLDFHSEGEMARVVNLISSWGHAAPMSEKNPKKVNDAFDGARISAVRPPAAESWAAFVRMFSLSVRTMKWLMDKPEVHNYILPRKLIYYLMRAEETTAFTGQQNTGKTTMMASAIADVELVNIRVLEMSFELALREAYPDRDIITVKPTEYVTSEELQDFLKKTDAYLSMVGEVAENIVAARMLQMCIIASAFTMFSHHAKDDKSLIEGLARSMVACGECKDDDVAVNTVLDAIKNNVHLDFITLADGSVLRYTAYISEIHKEETNVPYPRLEELMLEVTRAYNLGDKENMGKILLSLSELSREYYTRKTDRERFTSRKIVVFNKDTMTYEPNEWYSPEAFERMLRKLHGADRLGFLQFYYEYWRPECENPFEQYKQEVV